MAKPINPHAPIDINPDLWMYAERRGLCVVRLVRDLAPGKTDLFYIPWSKVRRAVATRDQVEASRKKRRV